MFGENQATNPKMISAQDVVSTDGDGDGVEIQSDGSSMIERPWLFEL